MALAEIRLVLEVAADDAAFQNAQAIDRVQSRRLPMAGIGAGTDARVAVLDNRENIIGIPHPVTGVARLARMIMKTNHDVVFLDHLLDSVDGVGRFSRHRAQTHFFGELENFPGAFLVFGDTHDAIIHRHDFVLRQFGFDLGNRFIQELWSHLTGSSELSFWPGKNSITLPPAWAVFSIASK